MLQNTHPGHKLHKNGEFLLFRVPKTTVVLHNPLMAQILQQLNLTLQSIHLLQQDKCDRYEKRRSIRIYGIFSLNSQSDKSLTHSKPVPGELAHLAGFLTVGIEGHLLGGQLAACVHVVAEVDFPERPAAQELSLPPVDWRPRRCRDKTPHDEKPSSNSFAQAHCDILV